MKNPRINVRKSTSPFGAVPTDLMNSNVLVRIVFIVCINTFLAKVFPNLCQKSRVQVTKSFSQEKSLSLECEISSRIKDLDRFVQKAGYVAKETASQFEIKYSSDGSSRGRNLQRKMISLLVVIRLANDQVGGPLSTG